MGLWSRIQLLLRIKASGALERAEDPREVLDFAYGQQLELLRTVRQGLMEVVTSKRRLERQAEKLRARLPQLEDQARRALGFGREDLARLALERKQTAQTELEGLDREVAEVAEEERKLTLAEQQLAARIEAFRSRRETVAARYAAAEAQVRVGEALSGVSSDLAELSVAIGRAEEKTERMQARASAIDALLDGGALAAPVLPASGDEVERALRQLSAGQAVEAELAALRAQPIEGQAPRALGSGQA
jgi:phage shock protein A